MTVFITVTVGFCNRLYFIYAMYRLLALEIMYICFTKDSNTFACKKAGKERKLTEILLSSVLYIQSSIVLKQIKGTKV